MCVVSAVMDYGQKQWPDLIKSWPRPEDIFSPGALPPIRIVPPHPFKLEPFEPAEPVEKDEPARLPTKAEIEAFLKLVKAAEEFDKRAAQPHCEDPEKIKLLEAIERRLAAIEAKLDDEPAAPPEPTYVTLRSAQWGDLVYVAALVQVIDLDTGAHPVDPTGAPYEIVAAYPDQIIICCTVNGDSHFYGLGSEAGANLFSVIGGRFEIRYPTDMQRLDRPTPAMQASIALHRELTGAAS